MLKVAALTQEPVFLSSIAKPPEIEPGVVIVGKASNLVKSCLSVLSSWNWVYVAVVYAIVQLGHRSVFHVIYAFIVSLFFGWIVKKTGSVIGVGICHGLINVGLYIVFPNTVTSIPFLN